MPPLPRRRLAFPSLRRKLADLLRPSLALFLAIAVAVGAGLRAVQLDRRVYWHDEAYTSLRAAGHTRDGAGEAMFCNCTHSVADLLRFQDLAPDSTPRDAIASLAAEDPQHPPLYFLLARGWMAAFGPGTAAARSLPVTISFLSLLAAYGLGWELFGRHRTAGLGTALLAVSPFHFQFARINRQYSLLTLATIASGWLLLRALRRRRWLDWLAYGIALALGLYAHPFFALAAIAQATFAAIWAARTGLQQRQSSDEPAIADLGRALVATLLPVLAAGAIALALYGPWLAVLLGRFSQAMGLTGWTDGFDLGYILHYWTLSFTGLLVDFDYYWPWLARLLFRLPFAIAILLALWRVARAPAAVPPLPPPVRDRRDRARWFLLASVGVSLGLLFAWDLWRDRHYSAVSRYLTASYPGVQMALAFWLTAPPAAAPVAPGRSPIAIARSDPAARPDRWQRGAIAGLLSLAIASCAVNAVAPVWWSSGASAGNADLLRELAAQPAPLAISDAGNDGLNFGNLLAIARDAPPETRFFLAGRPVDLSNLPADFDPERAIVYAPSEALETALARLARAPRASQP